MNRSEIRPVLPPCDECSAAAGEPCAPGCGVDATPADVAREETQEMSAGGFARLLAAVLATPRPTPTPGPRYCEPCDAPAAGRECSACGADTIARPRRTIPRGSRYHPSAGTDDADE